MSADEKLFGILVSLAMLIGGALLWRGCDQENRKMQLRHESYRVCIQAGKDPLYCRESQP